MNRAKAGWPKIASYCDLKSTTSKSKVDFQKLLSFFKTTSRLIFPRGYIALPVTMPWKVVLDVLSMVVGMNISSRFLANMILIQLPPSMNTCDMS